jgi:hypothetical protein
MKYDMTFEAEKSHGNCTGSFPDHRGAQRRHSDCSGC